MKIKRLYIKILLSFFMALCVTLILILFMFIVTAGRSFRNEINRQAFGKLSIFRSIAREKIHQHPGIPLDQNRELMEFLRTISQLFDTRIWITRPDRTVVLKTFDGPVGPEPTPRFDHWQKERDGIRLIHLSRRRISYYAQIPVGQADKDLILHILYDAKKIHRPEALFFFGILLIGVVIALLLVPLARFITKRVNQLNRVSLEFAGGNLACRAQVKGQDEIAKLAASFNFMADRLEKLIRGSQELTANVSHELRSPLARIRMSKELILSKLGKPGSRRDIQRLFSNIEDDIVVLDTLIDHMLRLSKMDFQAWEPSAERLDFIEYLDNKLAKYQPLFREKQIRVIRDLPGEMTVTQDETVLDSICSNLLDNAVKYTPEGGRVIVSARDEKGGLALTVTNTCPPLAEEALSRIFDPFFRLRGSRAPGHGLGLAIAKKQVERCRGRIRACNTENGLSFEIVLP